MTDYKQLCAELLAALESWSPNGGAPLEEGAEAIAEARLIERARAALAEPEPKGPTRRQLLQLAAEFWPEGCEPAQAVPFARAARARWGNHPGSLDSSPQPVPVAERLPGPGDCDAEGRCWIHMPDIGTAPSWRLVDPREIGPYHTHWLPAHALPVPGE